MDIVAAGHDAKAVLRVSVDDADIIVDRVNAQLCRPIVGVDGETAAITGDGKREGVMIANSQS